VRTVALVLPAGREVIFLYVDSSLIFVKFIYIYMDGHFEINGWIDFDIIPIYYFRIFNTAVLDKSISYK
jgi:hypothetical protein